MGTGIGSNCEPAAAVDAMDQTAAAFRSHVHQILHNETGPSLCAAGLHLELLCASEDGDERLEALSALREALEAAHSSIRSLLVESDPRLIERGGLDGALAALARHFPLEIEASEDVRPLAQPQGELFYRVARDWASACASTQPPTRLSVHRSGHEMRLTAPHSPAPWLAAWRHLGQRRGVAITASAGEPFTLVLAPLSEDSR